MQQRGTPQDQKLVIAVVQRDDGEKLGGALREAGHASLVLGSSGGFLRRGNATLLTLSSARDVEAVISIIAQNASERTEVADPGISLQVSDWRVPHSITVQRGGASVWVVDAVLAGQLPIARRGSGAGED